MSYRDDQFFRFTDGRLKPDTSLGDNPPFMYPGQSRHRLDTLTGSDKIKRGFIKSLLSDSDIFAKLTEGSDKPIDSSYFGKRMFFQFNPQLISQSVNQSGTSSLPFLQDPGQLTQPSMGETNFSFDIMLDRQMEMNQKRASDSFAPGTGPGGTPGLWDTANPYIDTNRDPKDIGVFADLKVLYQIIGQGLSAEQVTLYKSLQDRNSARSTEDSETSEDSAATTTAPATVDLTNTFADLNINAGNSAFLAPLPIRVVFSSLFMVDGFVTSTQVMFTKFNTNMVPIQARVAISMQAVYLGFAREKTVLSEALKNAEIYVEPVTPGTPWEDGSTIVSGDPNDVKKLQEFERLELKTFKIQVFGNHEATPDWDESVANGSMGDDRYLVEDILGNQDLAVYCGFVNAPQETKKDKIWEYMKDNNAFSLSYSFTLKVRRDYVLNDEVPDSDGKITLMTLDINSGMGAGMTGLEATTPAQYDVIRRMKLRAVRKVSYPNGGLTYYKPQVGANNGDSLWLGRDNYEDDFVNRGKRLLIEINFTAKVVLGSPDKGDTVKTYSTSYNTSIPPEKSYIDFRFPILKSISIPNPINPGNGNRR